MVIGSEDRHSSNSAIKTSYLHRKRGCRYGDTNQPLPTNFTPNDHTVICGRGRDSFESEGNRRFRHVVKSMLPLYTKASGKAEKSKVVSGIVQMFRERNPVGTFVKYQNGKWWEVGNAYAREKVGAQFRDFLHTQYRSSSKAKMGRKKQQQLGGGEEKTSQHQDECLFPRPLATWTIFLNNWKTAQSPANNATMPTTSSVFKEESYYRTSCPSYTSCPGLLETMTTTTHSSTNTNTTTSNCINYSSQAARGDGDTECLLLPSRRIASFSSLLGTIAPPSSSFSTPTTNAAPDISSGIAGCYPTTSKRDDLVEFSSLPVHRTEIINPSTITTAAVSTDDENIIDMIINTFKNKNTQ